MLFCDKIYGQRVIRHILCCAAFLKVQKTEEDEKSITARFCGREPYEPPRFLSPHQTNQDYNAPVIFLLSYRNGNELKISYMIIIIVLMNGNQVSRYVCLAFSEWI